MARLMVTLEQAERDALRQLATIEKRDPRAQAALLIRLELQQRGLLPVNPPTPTAGATIQSDTAGLVRAQNANAI